MSLQVYQVMHVLSGFLLTAVTFQAFAAPKPEARKRTLMFAGILSLTMLIGGFGAMARLNIEFGGATWIHVKLVCWLALSAMAGLAFRLPLLGRILGLVTVAVIATAIYSVYYLRTGA